MTKIVPERPVCTLFYMTTTDKKNIKDAISYGKEHNMPVYYLNFNRPVKITQYFSNDSW